MVNIRVGHVCLPVLVIFDMMSVMNALGFISWVECVYFVCNVCNFLPPRDASNVIPWWLWGQHDYSGRRVKLLVHDFWAVKVA